MYIIFIPKLTFARMERENTNNTNNNNDNILCECAYLLTCVYTITYLTLGIVYTIRRPQCFM